LKNLSGSRHPLLLSGWEHGEDAALWDLGDTRAGVFTLDFITPVVDDPFLWGQIAAANALSDVFAMGGRVLLALNIVCFPVNCLSLEVLGKILEGGESKVLEAGGIIAGGHSVEDEEPKYGLAVFGEVDKKRIWNVQGSCVGDELVLTKSLGTGIVATAIKADMAESAHRKAAIESMSSLNNVLPLLTEEMTLAVHASTDVTGFGMAGHLLDMLSPETNATIRLSRLPVLPGARENAAMGLLPAGAYRNRETYQEHVHAGAISLGEDDLLYDPQTSGGLLLGVSGGMGACLAEHLRHHGFPSAEVVGSVTEGSGKIVLEP
jgi:selenide,water dikinase